MLQGKYNKNLPVTYEKIDSYSIVPINIICRTIVKRMAIGNFETVEPHWHRSLEVIYTANSHSAANVNGKHVLIPEDSVYIINSYDIHEILFEECSHPFTGYTFQFDYEYIQKKHPEIEHTRLYADERVTGLMKPILISIADLWIANPLKNKNIIISLCDALIELLYTYASKDGIVNNNDKLFLDIIRYFENNCILDINMSNVGDLFNISYSFMARKFKKYLNMTPTQYLNQCRVRKSIGELCSSEINISEISFKYGFPNVSSYIREFKKDKGVTPYKYKQMIQRQEENDLD